MFTSWKITLILLVHYVILLAAATFVEKAQGTAMAREIIYNNPLFYLLQFLLILNFCATAWQARLWSQRKYGVLLLHISFIVILLGALVTNMFGFEELCISGRRNRVPNAYNGRPTPVAFFHPLG